MEYFFKGKKKSWKKIATHVWWTCLIFWYRTFFFWYLKIKSTQVSEHVWNISFKFWKLMIPHASPMNMLGFFKHTVNCPKLNCWRACFTISCSRTNFAVDPEGRTVRFLDFLNDIAKKIIVFSNTVSKSRSLIPNIRQVT